MLSGASYDPFADMDVPDEVLKLREIAANKMTDRQRQAYELIGLEERTITEAAKIMGVSIKVAKVHYDKGHRLHQKKFLKDFSGRVKILPFLLPVTCKEDRLPEEREVKNHGN